MYYDNSTVFNSTVVLYKSVQQYSNNMIVQTVSKVVVVVAVVFNHSYNYRYHTYDSTEQYSSSTTGTSNRTVE